MVDSIRLITTAPESLVETLEGEYPDGRHFDRIVGERDADVTKPDGSLLLAFRRKRMPSAAARLAWPALLRAAKPTNRRPVAAAGAKEFLSGTIGYLKAGATAFVQEDREGWRDVQPLLRALDSEFRRCCPDRHAGQREQVKRVPPETIIPYTAFTTATVNRNAQMGVHRDAGNLPGALGVMTVIGAGAYEGGLVVFPRYRVAVDLRTCDLLICDNREYHGNTAMVGIGGQTFERVSVVCYLHSGLVRAGELA